MNFKLLVILCILLDLCWKAFLLLLDRRSLKRQMPASVADVYDQQAYTRWRAYKGEKNRISALSEAAGYAVTLLLVVFNAYAAFDSLFPGNSVYIRLLSVVLLMSLTSLVVELPFSAYNTFVIEEKYGFNRSSVGTFISDRIKEFLIGLLFTAGLAELLAWTHISLGNWMIAVFAGAILLITTVLSVLMPYLTRMFNKFTPLEEGELRTKLVSLMESHGYKVRSIDVMDASRRSTKVNAYFTGMGPIKQIVLYDTLLEAITPDEIVAVFAHEMGHGLHHDVLKSRLLSVFSFVLLAVLAWLTVDAAALYPALGFESINYGMALVCVMWLMAIVQPLTNGIASIVSRRAEYAADAQAVKEGYGDALISSLKKLARTNMADLSPDPLLVTLTYSHPTLDQRIDAIEKRMADRK